MIKISDLPKIRGEYRENFETGKVAWFGVGGAVDVLFKPLDVEDLANFLREVDKTIPVHILGNMSNVLVRDGGLEGVLIRLGKGFNAVKMLADFKIEAQAGCLDSQVSNFALENGVGGLEFLATIPGNIGGAIAMNAGCYDGEMSDVLENFTALDFDGNLHTFDVREVDFEYRCNPLAGKYIFISTVLAGFERDKKDIESTMNENFLKREQTQPRRVKTGGSTFKNPPNMRAWELIKQSGADKFTVGGASFSAKHCNFLINDKTATSNDIERLIKLTLEAVKHSSGVALETEIKILGRKK
jgi:UDP-N-acetylmuramate dehydrogenase